MGKASGAGLGDGGGDDAFGLEDAADVGQLDAFSLGEVGVIRGEDEEVFSLEVVFDDAFDDEFIGVGDDDDAMVQGVPL